MARSPVSSQRRLRPRRMGRVGWLRTELRAARFLQSIEGDKELAAGLGEILQTIPDVDAGGVYLVDTRENAVVLLYHWGLSKRFVNEAKRIPLDSERGRLVQAGAPIISTSGADFVLTGKPGGEFRREKLRALAIFPLVCRDQVLGSLNLASRSVDAFAKAVADSLVSIAEQTARAFTRFRAAEAARRGHEKLARYWALIETMADGILILDPSLNLLFINSVAARLGGLSEEQAVGHQVNDVFADFEKTALVRVARQVLETQVPATAMGEYRCKDGIRYEYEAHLHPTPEGVLCICFDVSFRRRLQRQVIDAVGWERRNLAQMLHDGIGQQLTAATFLSRALGAQLASVGRLEESAGAGEIAGLLQDSQSRLRGLLWAIAPPLETRPLPESLARLAQTLITLFGVDCRIRDTEILDALNPADAAETYFIVQEAVMNAVRHGTPRTITIAARGGGDGWTRLLIEDDGCGFDLDAEHDGAFGLHLMRYRAERIGGRLSVQSRIGRGTRISCLIPAESREIKQESAPDTRGKTRT